MRSPYFVMNSHTPAQLETNWSSPHVWVNFKNMGFITHSYIWLEEVQSTS